jgi:peptide/nickel transport system substrate-binding protein
MHGAESTGLLDAPGSESSLGRYEVRRRHRAKWLPAAAALVVGIAVVAAGCGGGGGSKSSAGAGSTTSATSTAASSGGGAAQKTFPVFRTVFDTGIDFLDPGLSYTQQGWQIMWNVYLPLLGYKHAVGPEGATIVPYLAKDLPKVSAGGTKYSLTLRKGLRYSDGTPVKASDFRATIERDFKIDSPGVGFFANIVGADAFSKTKKGHITGIVTDDAAGTITIKLNTPQGDFVNILATEFAAPVPAKTPAKDQSTTPVASTGPYMIQSFKPNKSGVLVRNPKFDGKLLGGNVPTGNPDKITVDVISDPSIALQRVINGQDDWNYHQPPPDRLGTIQAKYANQYKTYIPANIYYFFMNVRAKPFDDPNVRKAVNFGIDRNALVRIYGGLGTATENVMPPTYPQYKKLNLYPYDLAKAKQLIRACSCASTPIVVWNHDRDIDPKATAYLADQLGKMGFTNVKQKIVNAAVYWTTVGNQATKAQIGFADWFQDYPHPLDWFDVLLNGKRITQTHNNNYANANFPAVNKQIDKLKQEPRLTPEVNAKWAQLDRAVDQNAPWAPFLNREFIDFFNADIDLTGTCYTNHVLYTFDFALACHK